MKMWALRSMDTKLYLPFGRSHRSNTYVEFTSKNKPRLFTTRGSAKNCLTIWMRGRWVWSNFRTNYAQSECEKRKAIRVEIVEFELVEVKK